MKVLAIACALVAFVLAPVDDASAQGSRAWVSNTGADTNACSISQPCATFSGALNKVIEGGIVEALTPGAFGGANITKAVTIRGTAQGGGTLVAASNGFTVNAPGKVVQFFNLQIDGATLSSPGRIGIEVLDAAQVTIDHCVIQNFSSGEVSAGVSLKPATGPARMSITNSRIYNSRIGVEVAPPGNKRSSLLLDRVFIDNTNASIRAAGGSAQVIARGVTALDELRMVQGATMTSYGDNAFPQDFRPDARIPLR